MDYVTARRAADLCGVNERTIRRHIANGRLQAERGDDGDYRIPTTALAQLRKAASARATRRGDLAGEVATLRAEVDALRSRLDALETRPAYPTSRASEILARLSRQDGTETGASGVDVSSIRLPRARPPERHRSASFSGATSPDSFANHADALRWLHRHGDMAEGTPKTWPGWREVALTPSAVLALAIACSAKRGVKWRLHACDDATCVCHALLGGRG